MAGVEPRDAGVAGGLVNVAHHTGGALGLGVLVTVFAAAGSTAHGPRELLAQRVSASLTVAALFLLLALIATLTANLRHRRRGRSGRNTDVRAAVPPLAAETPNHDCAPA